MVVVIDNNLTSYEIFKNKIVKIRRIEKDGEILYMLSYGNRLGYLPSWSVTTADLPAYYSIYIRNLYTFIGFDRNTTESDVIGLIRSLRNYLSKKRGNLCV